ncbi:ABC-2 transporter permease [Lysinibacillus sp. 54212]|uniref:ABC-2 transporter permease n=1 Tax=Lysinibacillus sp. 54212 TaxID=3119829 RepID=UPI002FC7962F
MFKLIRKDIMIQKTNFILLLPFLFVYLMIGTSSIWLGVLCSIVIITSAFNIDEKPSINNFLNSLPYTRKEIVCSKYIGAIIFSLIIVSTVIIGNLIIHGERIDWKESLLVVSLVLIFVSFSFPFSYKFKSQYLLPGFFILFVLSMVIVNFVVPKIAPNYKDKMDLQQKVEWFAHKLFSMQDGQLYLLFTMIVLVVFGCSWLLSIRIYSKKAF